MYLLGRSSQLIVSLLLYLIYGLFVCGFPDEGKWNFKLTQDDGYVAVVKSLFKESKISIRVSCTSTQHLDVTVGWTLRKTPCWEEYLTHGGTVTHTKDSVIYYYYHHPEHAVYKIPPLSSIEYIKTRPGVHSCNNMIDLPEVSISEANEIFPSNTSGNSKTMAPPLLPTPVPSTMRRQKREMNNSLPVSNIHSSGEHPQCIVPHDGVYILIVNVDSGQSHNNFNATVNIEMKSSYGYLSAVDWPLLPFYGVMSLVYLLFGVLWMVFSISRWRDLLRIQYWIGAVIVIGMLEKAVFYFEYQTINSTGQSVKSAVVAAEIISCFKRSLARMLVIIVSLGFGIVKPRLGSLLHRVVGVGLLYFFLASIEGCLRILQPKNDPSNQAFIASVPLSVLDSAICWWIFSSLVQTIRTLKLRNNHVKLSLYKHFTNTLVFSVIASVGFMLWSIKYHKLTDCLLAWKELWLDEAFWHILFSIILLVIIVLWRPSRNNQRYAFSPLLDAADDEESEEEEETILNEAMIAGMKMRRGKSPSRPASRNGNLIDEELKKYEEDSSLADIGLPSLVDSDEEKLAARFEVSKMQ